MESGLFQYRLLTFIIVLFLSACSGKPEQESQDITNLSDSLSSSTATVVEVPAIRGWVDTGVSVGTGQEFTITSTGLWSVGYMNIGETELTSSKLFCGAEGCNGETLIPRGEPDHSLFNDQGYTILEGQTLHWNDVPGYVARFGVCEEGPGRSCRASAISNSFDPNNIRAQDFASIKAGFAYGKLDGMTACFSADNILLGGSEPKVGIGWWHNKANAWRRSLEMQRQVFSRSENSFWLVYFQRMVELYENATCDNPVTIEDHFDIVTDALLEEDLDIRPDNNNGVGWQATFGEILNPVYYVEVPENNYREVCNSESDIILNYLAGKPMNRSLKNTCVQGPAGMLIMKIVPAGADFDDIQPIAIGKNYESLAFSAPSAGRVYLKANDGQHQRDNAGKLRVSLKLKSPD